MSALALGLVRGTQYWVGAIQVAPSASIIFSLTERVGLCGGAWLAMLEYIVRPFQTPNAHGTIIIPATPKESTETAVLTWGGEATLPEVKFIETGFAVRKGREDFVENKRDASTIRITGEDPGDGPSFIDVSRANKMYFDKTTEQDVNAASPGQTDYVGSPAAASIYNTPSTSNKSKATMALSGNTAAAS